LKYLYLDYIYQNNHQFHFLFFFHPFYPYNLLILALLDLKILYMNLDLEFLLINYYYDQFFVLMNILYLILIYFQDNVDNHK
jgi:hypothetical protein